MTAATTTVATTPTAAETTSYKISSVLKKATKSPNLEEETTILFRHRIDRHLMRKQALFRTGLNPVM